MHSFRTAPAELIFKSSWNSLSYWTGQEALAQTWLYLLLPPLLCQSVPDGSVSEVCP
jgi:hypothetical protein